MKTTKENSFCLFGFKEYIINITIFFGFIFSSLMMIYIFFQPIKMQEQKFNEVALFELSVFTMYEMDLSGLKTVFTGNSANRFSNRYTINDIDYTDNSKTFIANIKADKGVYKEDTIILKGHVSYFREDGLTFESEKAQYNKNTKIITTNRDYIIHKGLNNVVGTWIEYNGLTNKVKSKNVKAIYQLKESD